MKDDNKKITRREEDYSQWYLDVIENADLCDNSPVRGCMVIKPYGYAIWENIQKILDKMFKEKGVENAYFPIFIPKSFFEREAQHVEGFAKECAVVTHHRLKLDPKTKKLVPDGELDEPLIVRPTSETIMYDMFSKWISSYRDLPLLINQWANIVRWEMRTRPFLRTTEFLWQEGHTAHESKQEAERMVMDMIKVYKKFVQEYLAIPVIDGVKTDSEKFAGAEYTCSIEAMMQDGKALQSGTTHMLGQNFSKAFNVSFLDKDQKKQFVWQTSWGISTRIIGAIIMSHGDDNGLILPPKIASIQVVIVPIWKDKKEEKIVFSKARKIKDTLEKKLNLSVKIDEREIRPGMKYFEWERKGVPMRIEIGPKDIANKSLVLSRRDTGEKIGILEKDVVSQTRKVLEDIQNNLFERASKFLNDNTRIVDSWEDFKSTVENKNGFISAHFCGSHKCEEKIKTATKATVRCIPFDAKSENGKCIYCEAKSEKKVIFAKAY